jgi:hypothetical protein
MEMPRRFAEAFSFELYFNYSGLEKLVCHANLLDWRGFWPLGGLTGFWVRAGVENCAFWENQLLRSTVDT